MPPQYTPVIPPRPSPEGATSPIPEPPVIPTLAVPGQQPPNSPPNWARPGNPQASPGAFPGYMGTPFVQQAMPMPGSYYIAPVALPQGATTPAANALGNDGLSADWEGYHPTGHPAATPGAGWGFPGAAGPYTTPYTQPMNFVPAWTTPAPSQGPVPFGATPFMVPGGWAGATPFPAAAQQLPPGFPQPGPQQPPPQQQHGRQRPARPTENLPLVDKFAEDPRYGPVLEAFLVKVVKAKLELNPLLLPPPDNLDRPYLKWNMLFPTAQCQKSTDPPIRSWSVGRGAPATWPRVKSLRLISRAFPWDIHVTATDPEDGVTCGDVIDAIHEFMYGRVSNSQLNNATPEHKKVISQAFHHNRSTAYGVPGGKLMHTLLRCDWLGQHTMFGGVVQDKRYVEGVCGGADLPCTFELKCVQRYPMTAEEIREHEAREAEAEAQAARSSRRRHSRTTSRATSRASTRPPSRAPSHNGEEEAESEELV